MPKENPRFKKERSGKKFNLNQVLNHMQGTKLRELKIRSIPRVTEYQITAETLTREEREVLKAKAAKERFTKAQADRKHTELIIPADERINNIVISCTHLNREGDQP